MSTITIEADTYGRLIDAIADMQSVREGLRKQRGLEACDWFNDTGLAMDKVEAIARPLIDERVTKKERVLELCNLMDAAAVRAFPTLDPSLADPEARRRWHKYRDECMRLETELGY